MDRNKKKVSYWPLNLVKEQDGSQGSYKALVDRLYGSYVVLILVFTIMLIILTPIFRGLYFEREWFIVHLASFVFLIIWWVFRFFRKEQYLLTNSMDYAALALVIFYLVSLSGALYPQGAVAEFLKVAAYFTIYILVLAVIKNFASRERYIFMLLDCLVIAGAMVAVIGLAGAAGALDIKGLYDGTRIHSTLQYHNANGIYLSAMLLLALGMASLQKEVFAKLPYLGASFLFMISVVLTYSRGVWLVLAAALVIFLALNIPGQRLKNTIYIILLLIVTVFSVNQFERYISADAAASTFLLLGVLAILIMSAVYLFELFSQRLLSNKNITITLLILLSFSVLLVSYAGYSTASRPDLVQIAQPECSSAASGAANSSIAESLFSRAAEIELETQSVTERFIYYRTALRIARDYPLTGAGGGAWEALYIYYLGDDYHPDFVYTVEVHNHYLKILIETGIPGLLSFLALWLLFILAFLRCRFSKETSPHQKQLFLTIFMPAVVIGAHSAIDFSLSLGAISIMLWILFALGRSLLPDSSSQFLTRFKLKLNPLWLQLFNLIGLAVLVFLLVFTYNSYTI